MRKTTTTRLFAGHDAGAFTLPDEVIEARAAQARYATATWPTDPTAEATAALTAAVRQVAAGGPTPTVTGLAKARNTSDALQQLALIRRQVAEEVDDDVDRAVAGHADRIIVDHLQPAVAEIVATVTAALKIAPAATLGGTDRELLGAAAEVRDAALTADLAALRYSQITVALWVTRQVGPRPQKDTDDLFLEMEKINIAWPSYRVKVPAQKPPWPAQHPRGRLVWIVANDAGLWAPTAAQQDERWQDVLGQEAADYQAGQRQARATAGLFNR